jgi:hypothetical protein
VYSFGRVERLWLRIDADGINNNGRYIDRVDWIAYRIVDVELLYQLFFREGEYGLRRARAAVLWRGASREVYGGYGVLKRILVFGLFDLLLKTPLFGRGVFFDV